MIPMSELHTHTQTHQMQIRKALCNLVVALHLILRWWWWFQGETVSMINCWLYCFFVMINRQVTNHWLINPHTYTQFKLPAISYIKIEVLILKVLIQKVLILKVLILKVQKSESFNSESSYSKSSNSSSSYSQCSYS